jgi:hypothetical protein
LPERGADLTTGDRPAGFVGTSGRHHELGPIALGMVKRNVPSTRSWWPTGSPPAQEVLVDPEVGLQVRPNLR